MDDQQPHERKVCGAKNRDGVPCGRAPARGAQRCRLHGGASPWGPSSPHWRTGRHSRVLGRLGLRKAYQQALNDPESISLREHIAVIDARLGRLFEGLADSPDGCGTDQQWDKIMETIEIRRKLTDTQVRLLERLNGTFTRDQAVVFTTALVELARKYVGDPAALRALSEELRTVLERGVMH